MRKHSIGIQDVLNDPKMDQTVNPTEKVIFAAFKDDGTFELKYFVPDEPYNADENVSLSQESDKEINREDLLKLDTINVDEYSFLNSFIDEGLNGKFDNSEIVDIMKNIPEKKCPKNKDIIPKKRKLHEIDEQLSDENEEKRRIGAINAKKNREEKKALMEYYKEELGKEKERNKDLEYRLKDEQNHKKIAVLEKINSELKYEILFDKYEKLSKLYEEISGSSNCNKNK